MGYCSRLRAWVARKSDGRVALQALGLISFDEAAGVYWMRAFNDGRWLESEVSLADGEESISWGFTLGEYKTSTVLRINEKGEWTELGELRVGGRPPMKMMELRVWAKYSAPCRITN